MKILESGTKKQCKDSVIFVCDKCGCKFKANKDEYHECGTYYSLTCTYTFPVLVFANCPECHKVCKASKTDLSWVCTSDQITLNATTNKMTTSTSTSSTISNKVEEE